MIRPSMWRRLCSGRENGELRRSFFFLLAFYAVGIFSILRANRLYLDDMGRALYGYADWVTAARPAAECLSWFFYLSRHTVDASPFTQLLAAALLALVSLTLCLALRMRPCRWTLLATLPVGLSPYGLENLSYKFDSPFMALAVFLSVLPFLFFHHKGRFFLVAAASLFFSASLYQAAMGAYLALSGYILLLQLVSRKKGRLVLRCFFRLTLPFLLTVGVYAAQASLWFRKGQYGDYVATHYVVPPLSQLPREVAANIADYFRMLQSDWGRNGLGMLLLLLLAWFCGALFLRWLRNRRAMGPWAPARLLLLFPLLFSFLLTPLGVQLLLQDPVWSPRTYCAFGVAAALMLLSLCAVARAGTPRLLARCLTAFLVLQLLIFSQIYGNLLAAQSNWERSRMAMLIPGLSKFIAETDSTKVTFTGSIGQTPLLQVPSRMYPLLGRMVSVPLTRNWRWGYEQLKIFGVYVFPGRALVQDEKLTLFMDTPTFRIEQTQDGVAVVSFNLLKE
jgi:hypothetical protein